jgi:phosphoglycerate dehydrogenase-like enzyme
MAGEIREVLARVRWPAEQRRRLKAMFAPARVTFVDRTDERGVEAALATCDVAIVDGVLDDRYLAAPQLKWAHCDQSGLDGFAPQRLADSGLIVTSSKGRSGPVLAEHALYFMLALSHQAPRFARAQARRAWGVRGQEALRGLHGRKVCIVGLGATGTALARLCLALGMEVAAYRRRDAAGEVEGVRVFSRDAGDRLTDALAGADVLALCASLNDGSYRMVGPAELAAMKPGGFLVNLARAQLVDEAAMIAALASGQLGGAGVDVTDPHEPLPPWSRLWSAKNLILTPHVTPQMPDRIGRTLELLAANRARYLAGEPLAQRFTAEDVFTRGEVRRPFRGEYRLVRLWNRLRG